MTLTPFGEMLIPSIASLLNLEGMIYVKSKAFSNPETVVLKIGMSPLVNTKFTALLINSYKAQNSKHEILLIEENLSVLEEKLKNNDLDLILIPVVGKVSGKNSIRLYEEDLFYIDNGENIRSKVPIGDIRDKTFVMVPDSCGLSEITRSLLRTTRTEIHEYEGKALSYQVLADWASNGLGSAILPRSKIAPKIPMQQIYKSNKPAKITFEARWELTGNQPLNKLVQHFKNNINDIVRGLVD